MGRFLGFLFGYFLQAGILAAQVPVDTTHLPPPDSLVQKDTGRISDTSAKMPVVIRVSKKPVIDSGMGIYPDSDFSTAQFSWKLLQRHPYFGFHSPQSVSPGQVIHHRTGKEILFYVILLLLITYGLMRRAFPKYFNDLFRLFFRTTLKQRQIREQLMQTPLPSLMMNGFFVITAGLYLSFILQHFHLDPTGNFWLLFVYCCAGLTAIYLLKFLGLKISGWIFSMEEPANAYIFIVFVVNKMIGILLLPFLVLIAFTVGDIYSVGLTLSWCMVAGLLAYRIVLTYVAVRNQVKVNLFHFFIYLCAFEIIPLLLIYRALLLFFRITT